MAAKILLEDERTGIPGCQVNRLGQAEPFLAQWGSGSQFHRGVFVTPRVGPTLEVTWGYLETFGHDPFFSTNVLDTFKEETDIDLFCPGN